MRWQALVLGSLLLGPALAVRPLACGHGGRDVALVRPDGEVLIFDQPGRVAARRAFAEVVSIDLAPEAPLVAVLRRGDGAGVLELWDYVTGQLRAVAPAVAADARDVVFARGGHALLVAGATAVTVVDLTTLQPRRSLACPAAAGPVDLATSPKDWFFALAAPDGLWLGRSVDQGLIKQELDLPAGAPARVAFTENLRQLVVSTAGALGLLPLDGTPGRLLPVAEAGELLGLSSDSQFAFIPAGGRLHLVRLDDGRVHLTGEVRTGAAAPRGLTIARAWGTCVLAWPEQLVWYRPTFRTVAGAWPAAAPLGPDAPAPGPTPMAADPLERFAAVARVVTGEFFEAAPDASIFVLDDDFEALPRVEAAARQVGWDQLVLALCAVWLDRPDLAPAALAEILPELRRVDLIEFRGVRPAGRSTPAELERLLGPGQPTGIDRMTRTGQVAPLHRFGPLGLMVAGGRFVEGGNLLLTRSLLEQFAR